jgi:hypothetical protein
MSENGMDRPCSRPTSRRASPQAMAIFYRRSFMSELTWIKAVSGSDAKRLG